VLKSLRDSSVLEGPNSHAGAKAQSFSNIFRHDSFRALIQNTVSPLVRRKDCGPVPMWICGTRDRFGGKVCGIPHLAKNERDVGHPASGAGIEPKSAFFPPLTRRMPAA
jgi:hypothetical protein